MLPRHGCGRACASVHSCRRKNPFGWVAFMFAYSVLDTLDSGKHAWMIFVETLFLLHATDTCG